MTVTTLARPAPMIVPATPKKDISTVALTAARALATTWVSESRVLAGASFASSCGSSTGSPGAGLRGEEVTERVVQVGVVGPTPTAPAGTRAARRGLRRLPRASPAA